MNASSFTANERSAALSTQGSRSTKSSVLLGIVVALSLCAATPTLLWQYGASDMLSAELVLTFIIVLAGLRFSWIVASKVRRLHEMVFWLFVYLFLGIAPFIQLRSRLPGTTTNVDMSMATPAAVLVLVGCIVFIVGSTIAQGKARDLAVLAPYAVKKSRVYLLVAVTLALAVAYIVQVGPSNLFAARRDAKSSLSDSFGDSPAIALVTAGAKLGLLVAFVALMQLRQQQKTGGLKPTTILPILVAVVLFVCVNPISSARYVFGTVLLGAIAALGVYATVWRFRVVALSALTGIVVLFPLLDTFRRTLDTTVTLEGPLESMTSGDFDSFAQIMNTFEYVEANGIVWGNQLLGVLFFWVPRDIWPDKPAGSGGFIAEFKGYSFTNLSEPVWAEFYLNFGWVGMAIGLGLLGYLIARLDVRSESILTHSPVPHVLACITPFYLLILLRGSLLVAMTNLLVILICVWFVIDRHPKPVLK